MCPKNAVAGFEVIIGVLPSPIGIAARHDGAAVAANVQGLALLDGHAVGHQNGCRLVWRDPQIPRVGAEIVGNRNLRAAEGLFGKIDAATTGFVKIPARRSDIDRFQRRTRAQNQNVFVGR